MLLTPARGVLLLTFRHPASPAQQLQSWQNTTTVSLSYLLHFQGVIYRHSLPVRLRVHRNSFLSHCRQQLEVIDVVCWRVRIEEHSFFVERVTERMWRASGNSNVVAFGSIDGLAIEEMEAHFALRYEECLIVHFVPVRGRSVASPEPRGRWRMGKAHPFVCGGSVNSALPMRISALIRTLDAALECLPSYRYGCHPP